MKEINITFHGIDYWNRPVYKLEDKEVYVGGLDKLFGYKDTVNDINEYFRANMDELVVFGSTFDEDHDPLGTSIKKSIKLIIKD